MSASVEATIEICSAREHESSKRHQTHVDQLILPEWI